MKRMDRKKLISKKYFLGISLALYIGITSAYSQKVVRLSFPKILLPISDIKKIEAIDGNFFCIVENRFVHFKVENDSIRYAKVVVDNVKDFVKDSEKELFLLTNNNILSLNIDSMSVKTYYNLAEILKEPQKLASATNFAIHKNTLWLLGINNPNFLEKIEFINKKIQIINEKEQKYSKKKRFAKYNFIMTLN
jgi:hypothetical protein